VIRDFVVGFFAVGGFVALALWHPWLALFSEAAAIALAFILADA
jgi:hypothetical protein